MSTKSWIKVVGILVIFMGLTGLISNLSLLFSKLPDSHTLEFTWHFIHAPKLGLLVNLLFLMAGIFFILRKRFSIPLIYVALVADIFFRIIPALFFIVYHDLFFIMIRPVINLILLIIVFHLSASYDEPEKRMEFFGRNISYLPSRTLKLIIILGALLLFIPIFIQLLWIYIFSTVESYLASETFYSYFPEFMHGSSLLNYLSLACCIIAIISGLIGMKQTNESWRKVSTFIMALGSMVLLLNLTQLM